MNHPSLFAPLASPTRLKLTSSLLSSAATTVHSTPAAMMPALARFNMPHLSISACTVSSCATPTSALLSSSDVASSARILACSFVLVGPMKKSVKGTMLGKRRAAATLRRKGRVCGSSVHYRQLYCLPW